MFVPAALIGLHFYAGGLQRFVNRLGLATAKQVLLAGRTLDAAALRAAGAAVDVHLRVADSSTVFQSPRGHRAWISAQSSACGP